MASFGVGTGKIFNTIEELCDEWAKDGPVDQTKAGIESLRQNDLHAKYFPSYMQWRTTLERLKRNLNRWKVLRTRYYRGELDKEELKEHGWDQWQMRTLKTDIPPMIDAEPQTMKLNENIAVAEIMVEGLKSILKAIDGRSNTVAQYNKWKMWQDGEA